MPNKIDDEIRCSFCGKTQDEVARLIEGPGVYICDNCIDFCASLLFEDEEGNQDLFMVCSCSDCGCWSGWICAGKVLCG